MYQALYRKWRPKTFSDVIGQAHITDVLQKQVAEGRTSHAYLFTGTRGTGKTTCAKILAKAVNCERPVNGDPCNECPSCRGIESGGILDVLELDAASNNGVDQVRALRDEAAYTPANVKKRVYIIDEVHMLSIAAFNALLKILEEPPEHLMFILATTELHKVPPTILSRCQRFSFKRISPQDITSRLRDVAARESIDLKPDGAELLGRLADGALRDGLSLLDQCAAGGGVIDGPAVLETLGLAGSLQTARLLERVLARDAQAALLALDQLYTGGKDLGAVLSELSTLVRDLLLRRTAPEGGMALLSGGYDSAVLDKLGRECSSARLVHLATTLQAASAGLYESSNRRTDVELCLMRLCDESLSGDPAALAARIQRLEEQLAHGCAPLPAPRSAAGVSAPAPRRAEVPASTAGSAAAESPAPRTAPGDFPASGGRTADPPPWAEPPLPEEPPEREAPMDRTESAPPVAEKAPPAAEAPPFEPDGPAAPFAWRALAERCKGRLSPMYRAFLDMCGGTLENGQLTVLAPDEITRGRLDNDRVTGALAEEAARDAGGPVRVLLRVGEAPKASPQENLQSLLDLGGQFGSVEIK